MEEKRITFETAILAKEKGFDVPIRQEGGVYCTVTGLIDIAVTSNQIDNWNASKFLEICSAPTQALLQKWLREVHNIEAAANVHFYNRGSKLGYYYSLDRFSSENIHDGHWYDEEQFEATGSKNSFETYEEALEKGLYEALKLI
jgi:hypothetical protein